MTPAAPAAVRCPHHGPRAHRKNRQFRIERVFHPTEKKTLSLVTEEEEGKNRYCKWYRHQVE